MMLKILIVVIGLLTLVIIAQQIITYIRNRKIEQERDAAIIASNKAHTEMAMERKRYVDGIEIEPDGIDSAMLMSRDILRKHRAERLAEDDDVD